MTCVQADTDAIILHVGTNHLQRIVDNIRQLEPTLLQHVQLVQHLQQLYPGIPVLVSEILPRFDQCLPSRPTCIALGVLIVC